MLAEASRRSPSPPRDAQLRPDVTVMRLRALILATRTYPIVNATRVGDAFVRKPTRVMRARSPARWSARSTGCRPTAVRPFVDGLAAANGRVVVRWSLPDAETRVVAEAAAPRPRALSSREDEAFVVATSAARMAL